MIKQNCIDGVEKIGGFWGELFVETLFCFLAESVDVAVNNFEQILLLYGVLLYECVFNVEIWDVEYLFNEMI